MAKIELGTIQWSIEFKDGEMRHGNPRLDVLQDNLKEIAAQIPDGDYKWIITLGLEDVYYEETTFTDNTVSPPVTTYSRPRRGMQAVIIKQDA